MKPKQLKRANRKAWEAHKRTITKRWLDARMKILLQRALVEAGPEWAQIKLTDSLVGGQTYTFVMHCKQCSQLRPVPAGEPIEIYAAFPQIEKQGTRS